MLRGKLVDKLSCSLRPGATVGAWLSSALGDTIAGVQYLEDLRINKKVEVLVFSCHSNLMRGSYPGLKFYDIPFYWIDHPPIDINWMLKLCDLLVMPYQRQLEGWKSKPLQWVMPEVLGLNYYPTRPHLTPSGTYPTDPNKKHVVIATRATGVYKEWNHPTGWGEVAETLMDAGYVVYDVSLDPPIEIPGVIRVDKESLENATDLLYKSEFVIGLSSGISWLAWGLGKPVILISGFTEAFHEFETPYRIEAPKNVCRGCFHDPKFSQEAVRPVMWCPRKKHFECSVKIEPETVIAAVERLINDYKLIKP